MDKTRHGKEGMPEFEWVGMQRHPVGKLTKKEKEERESGVVIMVCVFFLVQERVLTSPDMFALHPALPNFALPYFLSSTRFYYSFLF